MHWYNKPECTQFTTTPRQIPVASQVMMGAVLSHQEGMSIICTMVLQHSGIPLPSLQTVQITLPFIWLQPFDMFLQLQATVQLSQLFEAHLSTLKAGPLVRQAVPGLRLPSAQHLVPHQLAVEGCDVHYRHRGRAPMSTLQERVLFSGGKVLSITGTQSNSGNKKPSSQPSLPGSIGMLLSALQ